MIIPPAPERVSDGKLAAAKAAGVLTIVLFAITAGCFGNRRGAPAVIDRRDLAVYQVVAESLYLTKARGRPIAIVTRTMDTVCDRAACAAIGKRWGLDSLWWAPDNAPLARQIRDVLISRAGTSLAWRNQEIDNQSIVLVDPAAVPPTGADAAAWSSFQRTQGVAALQFSPVGFSPDGSRALVVVRMRCGPRCGHTLAAALVARQKRWTVGELLLVASDG